MATHQKTALVRQQIVRATDDLLYHKGYNTMSFSDIAEASGIPRGNLTYHFKTKRDVLAAVLDHRLEQMRALLAQWDASLPTPLERLQRFVSILLHERCNVLQFGCPMGSLNTELGKYQRDLQALSRQQFDLFRSWSREQFAQWLPEEDADALAMHLLVRLQGIAVMSQVYADDGLLQREVEGVLSWLGGLEDHELRTIVEKRRDQPEIEVDIDKL